MERLLYNALQKEVSNKTCRVVITLLCISTISHHAQHALFQSPFNLFINVNAFYHSVLNSGKEKNNNNNEWGMLQKASKLLTRYSRTSSDKKRKVTTGKTENTPGLLASPAQGWIPSDPNLPHGHQPSPKPPWGWKSERKRQGSFFRSPDNSKIRSKHREMDTTRSQSRVGYGFSPAGKLLG